MCESPVEGSPTPGPNLKIQGWTDHGGLEVGVNPLLKKGCLTAGNLSLSGAILREKLLHVEFHIRIAIGNLARGVGEPQGPSL